MGANLIRLLLVEDDAVDQVIFKRFVRDGKLPYECSVAGSVAEAVKMTAADDFDIVVADYRLGDGTLFDLMKQMGDVPVVVTTGAGDEETAVKAMKSGACDYLVKDLRGRYLRTLPFIINAAVKHKQDERELAHYREHLEELVKDRTARLEAEIKVRRKVEAALRVSEQHLRSILESASGFAVYRLAYAPEEPFKLKVEFISPSIKQILGVDPDRFTAAYFFDNVHPDDRERVLASHTRAFEVDRFDEVCRVHNPAKMSWTWIQRISNGVRNEAGELTHMNGIFIDVTEKAKARDELQDKARDIEKANNALNVLLRNRRQDKLAQEKNIRANMNNLVFPALERLARGKLNDNQAAHLEIALTSLKEIMSSFAHHVSASFLSLSPTEIQVANFIKHGKSSKEIAAALNISTKTVKNQRQNIRKKMGLKNKKMNLRTYLVGLE